MNRAFFVDPESLERVVVRDVPSAAAAVFSNWTRATAFPRVLAAWCLCRRADAKNLEPYAQKEISVTPTSEADRITVVGPWL